MSSAGSISTSDYSVLIKENSLEDQLAKLSYKTIGKVIVDGINKEKRTEFVEAINPQGFTVYIKLDKPGYTTYKNEDIAFIENNDSVVPIPIKDGVMNIIGLRFIGACFKVGATHLHTVERRLNNPSDIISTTYKLNMEFNGEIDANDNIIAYPILRMSELSKDVDDLLAITKKVIFDIRVTFNDKAIQEFDNLYKQLKLAAERYSELEKRRLELGAIVGRFVDKNDSSVSDIMKVDKIMIGLTTYIKRAAENVIHLNSFNESIADINAALERLSP